MERMTKIDENIQTAQNMLSGIVERYYELEVENKKLKENIAWYEKEEDRLREENKKLEEENGLLKQCLDKLMFDADVVNVKIHGEIGDYVYVRSDKQFKLNVKE